MQTQTQPGTETEVHWRTKGPQELDYESIVKNDKDRYPFMEEFMDTVVTNTLRKTAKSYNKKSKCVFHQVKLLVLHLFAIGKLRNPKKVAKKAAKRMVHGDVDPWRKKCESYGFMLAKSMILMNAELLRDRMKPKNIIKDIGRDNWDYANDRVIGTSKGWNRNTMTSQMNRPRVLSDGRYPEEREDDSLMRATGYTQGRGTSAQKTQASAEQMQDPPSFTEANVTGYQEYADTEVLQKEFSLGKGLLLKAIGNIDDDYINQLKEHEDASEQEINACKVFFKVIWMLNNTKDTGSLDNWDEISKNFNESLQQELQQVPENIEQRRYDKEEVDNLREEFKIKAESGEDKGLMHNIKEFLCEAFCLIEIVEELHGIKEKSRMVSNVFY